MATAIRIGTAGGEYMEAVVVVGWAARVGDRVNAGDHLVTVETAKAATDIAAPCDGVLTRILAEAGSEVPVTASLGLIGTDAADSDAGSAGASELVREPAAPVTLHQAGRRVVASPAARRAARDARIDLGAVVASSPTGRIKLRDLPKPEVPQTPGEIAPLHIHRSGTATGTPVILLHGFASDSQSWLHVVRDLARAQPVLRIDLPSHGRSPRRRIRSFEDLASAIIAAFDALGIEQAHVIGHSLGGACALALADRRASAVATLTLIAPAGLGPEIDGAFLDGIVRASRPESLAPWLKRMVADPSLVTRDLVLAAMQGRADPGLRAAQHEMAEGLFPDGVQAIDLTDALRRLQVPASIVWGRGDRIVPWRHALQAPGRVGIHLLDTGHVPQLEDPATVLSIINAMLRSGG